MQPGWIRSNKGILVIVVIAVLVLAFLLVGFWVRTAYREARVAANLTPELVVRAFQDAGFEVNDLRDMNYYPGPMSPGERGVRFASCADDEVFTVLVVMYTNAEEARRAVIVVNEMNQRMGGTYGYAFYRGPIALVVGTRDEGIATEFSAVLKAINQQNEAGTLP